MTTIVILLPLLRLLLLQLLCDYAITVEHGLLQFLNVERARKSPTSERRRPEQRGVIIITFTDIWT